MEIKVKQSIVKSFPDDRENVSKLIGLEIGQKRIQKDLDIISKFSEVNQTKYDEDEFKE